jgi:pimeloyl-ACP methyl ester carboxylesterase
VIPLAAYGYTVIIPDYAGYSYGQAPPGYFNAEDEAHAVLDATRALAQLLPATYASDKVVFVGHSQGGHAVLSAEHYAKSYGMTGNLIGVATWAPFWTSMTAWGAITSPAGGFLTARDGYAILYSMFYFYSNGELRDGAGMGGSVFQPAKRDMAQAAVMSDTCFDIQDLPALGATPYDFYDQTFVDQVGTDCAALTIGTDCTQGAAPKWLARWKQDRPALDPMGPPILAWYAGQDTNVTPPRAQCEQDRFKMDLAGTPNATTTVSVCYDATSNHNNVPKNNADYVNQWIAARAGIGSDPAPCPAFPSGLTCEVPPNDF